MTNKITVRRALAGDAANLAVLLDIASHGLLAWVWSRMVSLGNSPLELGRDRILTQKSLPSYYKNWDIAKQAGLIAGGMGGYRIPNPYDPGDIADLPEVYVPLLELESVARSSWHLMALAVYREHRNQGIGSILLNRAEQHALSQKCTKISIIVHGTNIAAQRLYRRNGFLLVDQRIARSFENTPASDWLLFQKSL